MARKVANAEIMHQRRWLMLIVICISLMVIGLDNTILNVALPTLGRDLHASTSSLQWMVDSYVLVFAGLLLTAGSLGDRFGRYRALTLGLVVFGAGSLASAVSGSAGALIATRAFMGIGGAFIMPATLSIVTNVFTDPVERGKAIGLWAGVSALGIGIGPMAGGFLLAHFYWGSIFFVNLPIVVVALVGGWFLVPDSRDPSAPRLDPAGALLSIVGLAVLLWAVIEAPSHGWTSPAIVAGFATGLAVLGGFVAWELRSDTPMLDMRFFENPRFSAASGAITITFFTLFGSLFLLTQYLQSVLGYSTLEAGALVVPQAMVIMVGAPSSSGFVRRWGNKAVVGTGLVIVAVSLFMLSRLGVTTPLWLLIGTTMTLGLGMSQIFAPATDSIMGSLPRAKAGVGSAMNDTTRQTGGALGVAVLGSVLASRFHSAVVTAAQVQGLPADVTANIRGDIGNALRFAKSPTGRPYANTITDIARHAYVNAFHAAVLIGAVAMLGAAVMVVRWLPARENAPEVVAEPGMLALDAA